MTGTRTGEIWDAVAVLALLLPLAGVAVAGTGAREWFPVAGVARTGLHASLAGWVALLAGSAAPSIGALDPGAPAIAAAAGTSLLAAAAVGARRHGAELVAGPLAAAVAAGCVFVDPPASLGRPAASALVVLGAGVALAAVLVGRLLPVAVVVVPGGFLVSLWGAAVLREPPAALAVGLAVVAAALAWVPRPPVDPRAPVALAAVAAMAAPLAAVRPAGALLAAAVVLASVDRNRPWLAVGALPAAALAAAGLADVPVPSGPSPVEHAALAVALGAVVAGVVARHRSHGDEPGLPADAATTVAAAALVAWLVLAPATWRWAVPDAEALRPWDRAAATAAVAGLLVVVANLAMARRDQLPRLSRQ